VSREVRIDNGWVDTLTHKKLYEHGYSVGGYIDDDGAAKFVLYRVDDKFTKVHEFNSEEELNNMIKLLIPPEESL
jgi:hypothetical protein